MVIGLRGMQTAAAARPIICGAARQTAAPPFAGRQCFATAAQQATNPQQQEGASTSVAVRNVRLAHE
jgi:hypothetical protein